MSNSVNTSRPQHTKPVDHDQKKDTVQPQHHHKELFEGLMMAKQFDDSESEISTKKVSKATKQALAKEGGTCKVGNAEISRQKDMLCYRLLNGPMAGLIIQANYDRKGLRIKLFPHNSKQERAIQNILSPLEEKLQGRSYPVRLECVPPKPSRQSHVQRFMR